MELTVLWARQSSIKCLTSFLITDCSCEECCKEGAREDAMSKKRKTLPSENKKQNKYKNSRIVYKDLDSHTWLHIKATGVRSALPCVGCTADPPRVLGWPRFPGGSMVWPVWEWVMQKAVPWEGDLQVQVDTRRVCIWRVRNHGRCSGNILSSSSGIRDLFKLVTGKRPWLH